MSRTSTARNDADRMYIDPKTMSGKQLIHSVIRGSKITFEVSGATEVYGYLAGIDHIYFRVLVPNGNSFVSRLVQRLCNPTMTIHNDSTYQSEPSYPEMEKIIAPFRSAMRKLRDSTPGGS